MSAESIAALTGLDIGQAWSIMEQLTDEYLVQQKSPGRYELHDLLRAFARRKLTDDEPAAEQRVALHRLLSWYLVAADAAPGR
ncbi:hypothetical protein ACFQ9X_42870 [Catenulispora yoronensis]